MAPRTQTQAPRAPAAARHGLGRRTLALALLCGLSGSAAGAHASSAAVVDPTSQASCYTNETACESLSAGLCGTGQASQCVAPPAPRAPCSAPRLLTAPPRARPCVTGVRSYCAFAGPANTWYCPGQLPVALNYDVDVVSGTPCHASATSCGTLASNTCAAGECENGALSACAFTSSVRSQQR